MSVHDRTHRRTLAAVLAFAAPAFLLTACNDDPLFDLPPDSPTNVAAVASGLDVTVNWTPGENATSQEVRLTPVVAVPLSAGNALQAEDYVAVYNDNTTNTHTFTDVEPGAYTATVTAINASARVPSDVATVNVIGVDPPTLVSFTADPEEPTTMIIAWTAVDGAENYRVTAMPDDDSPEFIDLATASATSFAFTGANPGTTYTAQVCAIRGAGEACSATAQLTILAAPTITSFTADEEDPTTLIVEWTAVGGAENYRVTLTPDDDTPEFVDIAPASATSFAFEGVNDGTTYTAEVCAVFGSEEFCSDTVDFTADFFPWDEWFPTSLHETGAGKTTFYNTTPNQGFERFTGVAYSELACQGCHSAASGLGPVNGRGCDRCHDTADPGLGDVVDSGWDTGVCLGCHSRQTLEVDLGYSDVHRDMGFDCMSCHSLEDVHGDGNVYGGLMEIGAIDAACTNCHNEDNGFTHPATLGPHGDGSVACAACHAQTSVTCNNCHFEAQVPPITGKFFLKPPAHGWMWLGNRLKRDGSGETEVYPVNYQSVEYQGSTFVAFGFYTPHTIGAGRVCTDCHNNQGGTNPAIIQYNAEGIIDVASWDEATSTMTYPTGVIPMPEDYLTALQFDFVTTDSETGEGAVWTFLKAGADTIQVIDEYMTPLSFEQMSNLGMVPPGQ